MCPDQSQVFKEINNSQAYPQKAVFIFFYVDQYVQVLKARLYQFSRT